MAEDITKRTSRLRINDNLDENVVTSDVKTEPPDYSIPTIIERGYHHFRDITTDFLHASSRLRTGQLIKDEHFTLFESVSALEIMDPKMDSGVLEPGETLTSPFNILLELSPEDVLGIIEQMFCYEMAWHQGYPLSQTLFTSLYLDRILDLEPKTLEDARFADPIYMPTRPWLHVVLRAYCVGVIKMCGQVVDLIGSQHFYEEEDFVTHAFNRNLLLQVPCQEVITCLQSAAHWAEQTDTPAVTGICRHLSRMALLVTALNYSEPFANLERSVAWAELHRATPFLGDHVRGKPMPLTFNSKFVQRKLASTVPPRPEIHLSFEDALHQFAGMCKDILSTTEVLEFSEQDSAEDLFTILWEFASRVPQPNTCARAVFQHLLFAHEYVAGKLPVEELIINDVRLDRSFDDWFLDERNWQIEHPASTRHKAAVVVDKFLLKLTPIYHNLLRSLCQNSSRIRRNFQKLIQDLDAIVPEVEAFDKELFQLAVAEGMPHHQELVPLTNWTQHMQLRLMKWYVQLGFEHSLYKPHELGTMYRILRALTQMHTDGFLNLKMIFDEEAELDDVQSAMVSNDLHMWKNYQTSCLAHALFLLYTILSRLGLIPGVPDEAYGNAAFRLDLRKKAFIGLRGFEADLSRNEQEDEVLHTFTTRSMAEMLSEASQTLLNERKYREIWKKRATQRPAPGKPNQAAIDTPKALERTLIKTSLEIIKVQKALDREKVRANGHAELVTEGMTAMEAANARHEERERDRRRVEGRLKNALVVHVPESMPADYAPWWILPEIHVNEQ